jgi:hypothetical protein
MSPDKKQLDLDNYWTRAPFRFAVDGGLIRSHLAEGEVILRVGAVANAMLAIGRAVRTLDRSLTNFRDTLQYTILIASYAKEIAKVLNTRHNGLAWKLAEEGVHGGHRLSAADLSELRNLLAESSDFLPRA